MTGGGDDLRATLERLHEQLGHAHDLDDESRTLLRRTLDEIGEALDRETGPHDGEETSLAERLGEVAERFEESHPSLAEALGRVVNMLANLGI